jgi:hypothetical protein
MTRQSSTSEPGPADRPARKREEQLVHGGTDEPQPGHSAVQCLGCGGPPDPAPRYATAFCPSCVERTRCAHNRPVRLCNASLSGGLLAHHADDDSMCPPATDGAVTIDGAPGRAEEKRFGGVTVWPIPITPPDKPETPTHTKHFLAVPPGHQITKEEALEMAGALFDAIQAERQAARDRGVGAD